MLTRSRKRKVEMEEAQQRLARAAREVHEKFRFYRQHRDMVVHRSIRSVTRPEEVCYRVFKPVRQLSLKHAWLGMLSDVCATGFDSFQAQHARQECETCIQKGKCALSARFVQDYIQTCMVVLALAAQGTRSQLFVRASKLIMVEETRACIDKWYMIAPPHVTKHLRSINMETVTTPDEAPLLQRIYEMQMNAKELIQVDTMNDDFRTRMKQQLTQFCMLVNQITSPVIQDAMRTAYLQKAADVTYIQPTVPRGRSRLKEGARTFSGIRAGTRHAVAQQRNVLTGADRLGMYWRP